MNGIFVAFIVWGLQPFSPFSNNIESSAPIRYFPEFHALGNYTTFRASR